MEGVKTRQTAIILGIAIFAAAAILSLVLASSALGPRSARSQAKSSTGQVSIDNYSFTPSPLEIPPGTQVTWINKDDVPHTVVSTDRKFKSQALDTSDKFSFTFQDPGTYEYFCSVHPKMTGKIVVK